MPNDTLDEIWARWKRGDEGPPPDIRTLIEMVRARDRVVTTGYPWEEATIKATASRICEALSQWLPAPLHRMAYEDAARAAIDTPPAQEPTE